MPPPIEISVVEASQRIASAEPVIVLDCREPAEREEVHLPESLFIPMGEIPQRLDELEVYRQAELFVYCHLGIRSLMVVEYLRHQGFAHVQSMAGGIEAWIREVDPQLGQS